MSNKTLDSFLDEVKPEQTIWALQDQTSEDWVILDSINFDDTDVMPVWSSEVKAKAHCIEEWASYTPTAIPLADWFEFWVEDLNEDNIIIGVNWAEDDECVELELADFTQAVAQIEAY